MTYLELVQKAVRWSGVRSTEPTTLVGADGLIQHMADLVSHAWTELQLEREDWRWNKYERVTGILTESNARFFVRTSAASGGTDNKLSGIITFDTADGSATITSADLSDMTYNFEDCKVGINDDTTATTPDSYLGYIKWDDWRYHLEEYQDDTEAEPTDYTITPQGDILVHPVPDADYRLYFETQRYPQELASDGDEITLIPEYLQNGVVWRTILYYALYIQDTGMMEMARLRYRPYKKWLENREMPDITLGEGHLY